MVMVRNPFGTYLTAEEAYSINVADSFEASVLANFIENTTAGPRAFGRRCPTRTRLSPET